MIIDLANTPYYGLNETGTFVRNLLERLIVGE